MGLKSQIPQEVEGISFAPLLRGKSIKRPSSQLYFMIGGQLLNEHQKFNDMRYGERGVRTDRYTLVVNKSQQNSNKIFLWDRIKDPYQLENIANKKPELVKGLIKEELEPWLRKTNDPWLTGKNGNMTDN